MMSPDSEDGSVLASYNPYQGIEERRGIASSIRALEAEMNTNQLELIKPDNNRLSEIQVELDVLQSQVRQTGEAAIDAKAFQLLTDLVRRKTMALSGGPLGTGIDPDELLTKVKAYLRTAAGIEDDDHEDLTHTQRARRRPAMRRDAGDGGDDDEDNGAGDMLNWPHLGRYAALPNVRRPALPGFLLGPLSVQKKARKVVIRTAPLRIREMHEVRPEVIRAEDIEKNEAGDLTAICAGVHRQLTKVQTAAHAKLARLQEDDDVEQQELEEEMEKLGIAPSGNVDLVRFYINPKSFAQTVENLFYVSFLIKEGHVTVQLEENGLPSLCKPLVCFRVSPIGLTCESGARTGSDPMKTDTSKTDTKKHQAIFSIDMTLWEGLIKAYNIKEPMIEHRQEARQQGPGAKGWYG